MPMILMTLMMLLLMMLLMVMMSMMTVMLMMHETSTHERPGSRSMARIRAT